MSAVATPRSPTIDAAASASSFRPGSAVPAQQPEPLHVNSTTQQAGGNAEGKQTPVVPEHVERVEHKEGKERGLQRRHHPQTRHRQLHQQARRPR
eukprot:CAMPEP_0202833510 /NCGR_PEP_ID=MMETSP1389-20130828/25974_1 /ASSEMBLY_ACC=CAM_ASM_000865 /TAXON_ID=302021 /ORGANISM="Rhodomonas sp., Strain CCMP768" /LENGTH=94 /DNA_ID=CAMNT_0049508209 /DNA_START=93 /DNA_END=376 /DNA_ORIENTATION=+